MVVDLGLQEQKSSVQSSTSAKRTNSVHVASFTYQAFISDVNAMQVSPVCRVRCRNFVNHEWTITSTCVTSRETDSISPRPSSFQSSLPSHWRNSDRQRYTSPHPAHELPCSIDCNSAKRRVPRAYSSASDHVLLKPGIEQQTMPSTPVLLSKLVPYAKQR